MESVYKITNFEKQFTKRQWVYRKVN
jgi:hypothetical protein